MADMFESWIMFYDIKDKANKLEDGRFYLILHDEYSTPREAQYHDDIPHFTFYTDKGTRTTFLFENKISHFAELLSKDEYYEFIKISDRLIEAVCKTSNPIVETNKEEE